VTLPPCISRSERRLFAFIGEFFADRQREIFHRSSATGDHRDRGDGFEAAAGFLDSTVVTIVVVIGWVR
jgi:hypothetical protein